MKDEPQNGKKPTTNSVDIWPQFTAPGLPKKGTLSMGLLLSGRRYSFTSTTTHPRLFASGGRQITGTIESLNWLITSSGHWLQSVRITSIELLLNFPSSYVPSPKEKQIGSFVLLFYINISCDKMHF